MTAVVIFTIHSAFASSRRREIPRKTKTPGHNKISSFFPLYYDCDLPLGRDFEKTRIFFCRIEYSRSARTITTGPFFFIENGTSRRYRATLFVNILLSYISCLTEISNVSKEKTEMAKRTANISRRAAGRYTHGFCRPHPSRNTKATRIM